jgi:serine/threonine-protein kinase ULK2
MKSLKHDHIVQLIDCQQTKEYIHLIMDYCALGDLSQFIKRRNHFTQYYGPDLGRTLEQYPPGNGGGLNEHLVKHFLRQLGMSLFLLADISVCGPLPTLEEPNTSRPQTSKPSS